LIRAACCNQYHRLLSLVAQVYHAVAGTKAVWGLQHANIPKFTCFFLFSAQGEFLSIFCLRGEEAPFLPVAYAVACLMCIVGTAT
jgi:hypothetical protein